MRAYRSPSYSISAPCASELHRIRIAGCSGTTLHSRNFLGPFDADLVLEVVRLARFCSAEPMPPNFVRSRSSRMELRRRAALSSSSGVDKGRTNSRGAPPGAWTMQPRIVRMPVSAGEPCSVTVCSERGGMTTCVGYAVNGTPDVLRQQTSQLGHGLYF